MDIPDTIWVVVNAEDTQGQANSDNAHGCRELCDARIKVQADMMYPTLTDQAEQLHVGARIVMHQGGARRLGGQLLKAAGHVALAVRLLTSQDAADCLHLWKVTAKWYKYWPHSSSNLHGELFIKYDLKEAKPAVASPKVIRPMPGDKFIPIHENCQQHSRCKAYPEVYAFWHRTVSKS